MGDTDTWKDRQSGSQTWGTQIHGKIDRVDRRHGGTQIHGNIEWITDMVEHRYMET